jgi:uncharacterized protein YjbI with pentapeptide repeats
MDKQQRINELCDQIRTGDNQAALGAVDELRATGWLVEVLYWGFNINGINWSGADLTGADLRGANLRYSMLNDANLKLANLTGADLRGADLSGANLTQASLGEGYIYGTKLIRANLRESQLHGAVLCGAIVDHVDFAGATLNHTMISNVDLSQANNLEDVIHQGPSHLSTDTLFKSQGKIPEAFLRGCDVPEILITYLSSMMGTPIEMYSCFISYSHANKTFVQSLENGLKSNKVHYWLDEKALTGGDFYQREIYRAIRIRDKLVICVSIRALKSGWIEKEFRQIQLKEDEINAKLDEPISLVIPLDLDGSLLGEGVNRDHWIVRELLSRHVIDCRNWESDGRMAEITKQVVRALRTDGGKLPHPPPKL